MNMRDASVQNYGLQGVRPTYDEINSGSLQRIADATEKMAGNFTALQNKAASLERDLELSRACSLRLARQNTALRGVITRIKNKKRRA